MKKRLIVGLTVLNAAIGIAVFAKPVATQILPASVFRDCCQGEGEDAFCCEGCCFFVHDCRPGAGDCDL